jgi:hypothetical protein
MDGPNSAPVLDITDGRGNLLPDAIFRVLATMFHPQDPEERSRCIETLAIRARFEAGGSLSPNPSAVSDAIGEQAERAMQRLAEGAYGASVAGDLLLLILNAAAHSPKDASLARAMRVWCQDQARGRTHRGAAVAASERSLRVAWIRHKPVAHFCAAWQLHRDFGEDSKIDPLRNLPNFLAVAEALRIQGELHHPPTGRTGSKAGKFTTLDPRQTWHLPSDLKLPDIYLKIPPLTEFVVKVFREYRAD